MERMERDCVELARIERCLWDHGLTPNYSGFVYLRTALHLALQGGDISSGLLAQTAVVCQCSRTAVYQGIQTALERMERLPRIYSRQRVYILIRYLAQQLEEDGAEGARP